MKSGVFNSMIEYSVKTIVVVLCSSINCKVVPCDDDAVLSIGGSILSCDIAEQVESCADILGKLKARGVFEELPGILCNSLLYSVLRGAVSASSFRHVRELGPVLDARPADGRTHALSKIPPYVPKEMYVKKGEIPPRMSLEIFRGVEKMYHLSLIDPHFLGIPWEKFT